jgi:predicted DNA-binding protein (UPF0251 family)
MIENIRKYTGLIIVLFVLVIIGFFFMDTSSIRASQGGASVLKIEGREYSDKEYRNLGISGYELTQGLAQAGDFQLYSFLFTLSGNATSQDQAIENFFINRILLRSAKEEFGIYPGEEEIDSFIRQLRVFTGPDGAFSQEQYRNFIERGIGRLGLTEGDIRVLASDIITQRKLTEILGSGLSIDHDVIEKQAEIRNQRIDLNLARIDLAPIEEKIDTTEEEIKEYWETVQDAFKTREKRKFTYLIAKPQIPALPEEIPAPAEDAGEEAKEEYQQQQAARTAAIAEAKRQTKLKSDQKVQDFLPFDSEGQEAFDFETKAQEMDFELTTTELFTKDETPEELNASLRSSSSQGTAVDELFKMNITSDPFSKISQPLPIGENGWLIARLDEIEEVRVKTYEEARNEARARLIAEKSAAALAEAAEAATEKIQAALSEGKNFAEAAEAAGISNKAVSLSGVTQDFQPDTKEAPVNLFDAAKYTNPGELSNPVLESDRAFIIHVESRQIVKDENFRSIIESQAERAAEENKFNAFTSWLEVKTEAADVQRLTN